MAAITRRTALGAGLGGTAALLLGTTPTLASDETVPTFVLDPFVGRGGCTTVGPCASCSACVYHAANKIFTSEKAALTHLAHPHCRCGVVDGPVLLRSVYDQLFGSGLTVVDRRWTEVATALGANDNQRSVPMFDGAGPIGVVLGGVAAAAWWVTRAHRADAPVTVPVRSDR